MSDENASVEGGLEIRLSRFLPAAPDEVFDAYTDADKQKVWFSILDAKPGIVDSRGRPDVGHVFSDMTILGEQTDQGRRQLRVDEETKGYEASTITWSACAAA